MKKFLFNIFILSLLGFYALFLYTPILKAQQNGPPAFGADFNSQIRNTPSLTLQMFGAKPGNASFASTNSVSLQNAINYGIANRVNIQCTPGIYYFDTGLTMAGPGSYYADTPEGEGVCTWMYTGSGTALTIGTGTEINGINMKNIIIAATNSSPAARGIFINRIGHAVFDHVSVGGGYTTGSFVINWEVKQVGFAQFNGPVMSDVSHAATGFKLDDYDVALSEEPNAEIEIYNGDFDGFARAIEMDSCYRCHIHDNHWEANDYGIVEDANNVTNLVDVTMLTINNNYFLSNGTGSNKKFFAGFGASGKYFNSPSITFINNQLELVSGGVTEPIYFTTAVGNTTIVNIWVGPNYMDAANTAILYADSPSIIAYFIQPQYFLDHTGAVPPNCAGSALCPQLKLNTNGTYNLLNNTSIGAGAPTNPTNVLEVEGSSKTLVEFIAGASQSSTNLVQFVANDGVTILGGIESTGAPYYTDQHGPFYYNSLADGPRWEIELQNPEVGSNSGSDMTFNAFDDTGTYLSTPFIITRQNGEVTFSANVEAVTFSANGNAGLSGSIAASGSCTLQLTGGIVTAKTGC